MQAQHLAVCAGNRAEAGIAELRPAKRQQMPDTLFEDSPEGQWIALLLQAARESSEQFRERCATVLATHP
jgi:hypothetical protein